MAMNNGDHAETNSVSNDRCNLAALVEMCETKVSIHRNEKSDQIILPLIEPYT